MSKSTSKAFSFLTFKEMEKFLLEILKRWLSRSHKCGQLRLLNQSKCQNKLFMSFLVIWQKRRSSLILKIM